MGHLLSTIEFAKLIIKHNPNISILVIIFDIPAFSITAVESYIDSQSRELDTNRFTFMTLPPLSNPPDPSSPTFFRAVIDLQKPLVEQALAARSTKPAAFVVDMLCVTMIDIANELGVPSYIYFTAGMSLLNIMLHFQAIADDKGVDALIELNKSGTELDLPGFREKVPMAQVLPMMFSDPESGWFNLILDLARMFQNAKGILVNTFMELESYAVEALNNNQNITAYPVGPILMLDDAGSHKEDRDSIMRWLDAQPPSSVVFLCFGSMGSFDEDQVKEIAHGLEQSAHRFLWSLRRPSSGDKFGPPSENETFEEALPEGFLDRTAHRGKIIGWAPQAQILGHQAVGGFVSHCGWNSILESMWFGVPIATWPIYSEQQLNAFELVKELQLAVEIRMDYQKDLKKNIANFTVMAEEVKSGVNKLMGMDDQMKGKIREMSDKSRKGLENGGSSHNWLTRFITEVLDE
ncbi:UDP-glucose flavonoid 3-O-glucosyltransferase 6 [Bienertia sinuspersici]